MMCNCVPICVNYLKIIFGKFYTIPAACVPGVRGRTTGRVSEMMLRACAAPSRAPRTTPRTGRGIIIKRVKCKVCPAAGL